MVTISESEAQMINRLRFLCLLFVVMIHSAANVQPVAIVQPAPDVHTSAKMGMYFFCSAISLKILFILSASSFPASFLT